MAFWSTQSFWINSKEECQKEDQRCSFCHGKLIKGELIAIFRWDDNDPGAWGKGHIPCAENHPLNIDNMQPEQIRVAASAWTEGTQRQMIDFVHNCDGVVEVRYDPSGKRDRRYLYRKQPNND